MPRSSECLYKDSPRRRTSLILFIPAASQDSSNYRIRRVDLATWATSTLAGDGTHGFQDGASAHFWCPTGIAIDPSGTFALVAVHIVALRTHKHIAPSRISDGTPLKPALHMKRRVVCSWFPAALCVRGPAYG